MTKQLSIFTENTKGAYRMKDMFCRKLRQDDGCYGECFALGFGRKMILWKISLPEFMGRW